VRPLNLAVAFGDKNQDLVDSKPFPHVPARTLGFTLLGFPDPTAPLRFLPSLPLSSIPSLHSSRPSQLNPELNRA